MQYVYPVVSRRAGGVSIGINLNPNNACNWRCIYCQVPGLVRGGPPPLDLPLLERELRSLLGDVLHGSFMADRVPEEARRLSDIAFSGNGEPTSAPEFPEAIRMAARVAEDFGILSSAKLRLITNGSLLDRKHVRGGIQSLREVGGEVWFKLDAATPEAVRRTNGTRADPASAVRRLVACAGLCETWVQSCFFALDGKPPTEGELSAYLAALESAAGCLGGVYLYGLARPSLQPEAARLGRLEAGWLDNLAARIRRLGLTVKVSP